MDRFGQFSSPLLGSFSLPSLAEGSEAISEAEEINEVKSLHDRGVRAAKSSDFEEAIQFYNEALEIDHRDVAVLEARSLAYLQQHETVLAAQDADAIIAIDPENAQGLLLQGLAFQQTHNHKAALVAMLTALDLDKDSAEKLTNHIASTVSKFCPFSEDLAKNLKTMDPYEKLSEVGVLLFHNKKLEECIQVLEAARKFQTNQKGITMRVLLTLANAHSQLLQVETAIALYKECLSLAVATHEQVYQTKSLVNIATLYLENGETYQAIIFYEKLLHLEAEIMAAEMGLIPDSQDAMPSYWTKELQCGLHLNLSIAYKTIGNMESAIVHARKYMALAQEFGLEAKLVSESHHNTGMLNEILGNFQEALRCYTEYLSLSKASGNRKGIGQAYGCLASVYAALRNWPLSLSYHDQYIAVASKSKDKRLMAIAHEMKGDSLCLKKDFDLAIDQYNNVLILCRSRDNRGDATSRCKMAAAYKAMGQLQYSLYYYNEALALAQKFGLKDIETMCDFQMACINKDSTQYLERDGAQRSFMKLIPFFEKKIAEHLEENSYCPEEYENQLTLCYDGMQTVLSHMSNKFGCLQYAEAHRKRKVISLPNFQASCKVGHHSLESSREIWGTDHMKRIVSEQNATVLYYSLLDQLLLIWVLQPGQGVTRFYTGRSYSGVSFSQQITDLLAEMEEGWNRLEMMHSSESRALPLKDADTQYTRAKNFRLSSKKPTKMADSAISLGKRKPAQRRLFDILVAPVMDILEKTDPLSHLVIVPDKQLQMCPFGALLDYRSKPLSQRFNITYVPCLLLLDRVIQNEMSSLSAQDDLDFQRQQCCKGGLPKQIGERTEKVSVHQIPSPSHSDYFPSESETSDAKDLKLNLREVSNPRLASSGGLSTPRQSQARMASRESTFVSVGGRSIPDIPPAVPEGHVIQQEATKPTSSSVGMATSLEKMLAAHTYSTLTTKTWTGTDITSSTQVVPHFQQLSDPRSALVFGSPTIKSEVKIHGKTWKPRSELMSAQDELSRVAEYLGTHPILGEEATRQELLTKLETAELVHLGTWACLREGLLLVTPEPLTDQSEDFSHLVTIADIMNLHLRAKVVVLSSCGLSASRSKQEDFMKLASSFLSAGALCVLGCLWPIPDITLGKFFFHFYDAMQKSAYVSEALRTGLTAIQNDARFNHVHHWASFSLIGKDSRISISKIRHAHLDQMIDRCEMQFEEESEAPTLNPRTAIPTVASKEKNLMQLQRHVRSLLKGHFKEPRVLLVLIDMLDSALKRLHTTDNNRQPNQLSDTVIESRPALALLKWLGFHFQAKGAELSSPYVIFPHWNTDDLIIPTYDALKAALDLCASPECVNAFCEAVPISQENVSGMIDLMCITKHAPEIQLKVTDLSVNPLWHFSKTRAVLDATGFHQVGTLLTFNMRAQFKQLLVSMLQLLLSVSCHKSPVLLYRLDVNMLGHSASPKSSYVEHPRLPSLTPLILPRNQLRMSTPWFSVIEQRDEMTEKMKLAKSTSNLSEEFQDYIERAKSWHQTTVVAQANETLDRYGRPFTTPKAKVKVLSGATASLNRVPVDKEKVLTTGEVKQRRDYAHFVLHERVSKIDDRRKDNVIKLYLPFVKA